MLMMVDTTLALMFEYCIALFFSLYFYSVFYK